MEGAHEFELSSMEYESLKQLALRDELLAALLSTKVDAQGERTLLRLNRADVEQVRDCLTTMLAEVGFDEEYLPNEQGIMLERLIDKLYVR